MYKRPGRLIWYASLSDTQKHISLGTEDEEEAKVAFARLLERTRHLDLAPNEEPVAELVRLTRERGQTNNTDKTAYELHLNLRRVAAWLEEHGIFSVRKVDKALIEDYKTARRFSVGPARINAELSAWRRMMKLAVELNYVHKDVLDQFVRLKEPRPEPHRKGLSKANLLAFLKAEAHPGYRALYRVVLGSGMRDEEMRHMEAGDIRRNALVVTPKEGWTTKSYRYRTIPITGETAKAARAFLKAKPKMSMGKRYVWGRIQKACKAAGVAPFSLHELRRAWASHMLKAGHPIASISKWMGHENVMTTMRYLRFVEETAPDPKTLPW